MNKDIKDEGIWKFYDEDGTLIKEEEYHNDKLIKTKQYKDDITHEMHNDYCAARASVLGAEYALKEMTQETLITLKTKQEYQDTLLNIQARISPITIYTYERNNPFKSV